MSPGFVPRTFVCAAAILALLLGVQGLHGLLAQAARPAAAQARAVVWKVGASWPSSDPAFALNLKPLAERVERMSGGRLKWEIYPAGAIVPAFEVLDATHRRVLDAAHSCSYYWVGKHKAAHLFTGAPGGPFGMDLWDFYGWMYYGGGWELLQELYQQVLKMDIVAFPVITSSPQAMGWFRKPFKTAEELKGLKYRVPGVIADLYREFGMSPVMLPGGEIVPALERGVIDAAEWAFPLADMMMGFHQVLKYYYLPGMHETTTTCELEINKKAWEALSADLQAIVRAAVDQTYLDFWARITRENSALLRELKEKHAVNVVLTPPQVQQAILKAWDRLAERESKDPFFKKVYESMRTYAGAVVPYRKVMWGAVESARDHYWQERYVK
jgi:TRAP-type mannitol/chloroaromatic compound transport system substrate-binding protein